MHVESGVCCIIIPYMAISSSNRTIIQIIPAPTGADIQFAYFTNGGITTNSAILMYALYTPASGSNEIGQVIMTANGLDFADTQAGYVGAGFHSATPVSN